MTPRHVMSSKAHEGHVAVHAHGYTTPAREEGEREGVRLWRPTSLRRLGTAGQPTILSSCSENFFYVQLTYLGKKSSLKNEIINIFKTENT